MDKQQRPRLRHPWLLALGVAAAALVLALLLFRWDWLIPLAEREASSAAGRQVTLRHLHVAPGRVTRIVADDVEIAGGAANRPLATIARLDATVDALGFLRHHVLHVFRLDLDRPVIDVSQALLDAIDQASGGSTRLQLDALQVQGGQARAVLPNSGLDATLSFATSPGTNGRDAPLVGTVEGSFRSESVSGKFSGGSLASLQDAARPAPVSLQVSIGQNRFTADGTLRGPAGPASGTLQVSIAGPHFADLATLLGLGAGSPAAYSITSPLTLAGRQLRFERLEAKVGSSVLAGRLTLTRGPGRPDLSASLGSARLSPTDFASFDMTGMGPGTPLHLPRPDFDAQLTLRVDRLEYRKSVVENVALTITESDGRITLSPAGFDAAGGKATASFTMELGDTLGLQASVNATGVQLRHLLNGPGLTLGGGSVNGHLDIRTNGDSTAALLGHADGRLMLLMSGGADLNGILTSMAGLDFRAVFLSSLGIATSEQIRCALLDFNIKDGIARPNRLVIDTRRALIRGTGMVDLGQQTLDLTLRPTASHAILGPSPGAIRITGSLYKPDIRSAGGKTRQEESAVLGLLDAPLALLESALPGGTESKACTER